MSPSAIDLQTLQELPLEVQQEVATAMAHARKFPITRQGCQSMLVEAAEHPAVVPQAEQADVLEDARLLWPRIAEAIQCIEELAEEVTGMLTMRKCWGSQTRPLKLMNASNLGGKGRRSRQCPLSAPTHHRNVWVSHQLEVKEMSRDSAHIPCVSADSDSALVNERLEQLEEILLGFGTTLAKEDMHGLSFLLAQLAKYTAADTRLADSLMALIEKLQETFGEAWEGKQLSKISLLQ